MKKVVLIAGIAAVVIVIFREGRTGVLPVSHYPYGGELITLVCTPQNLGGLALGFLYLKAAPAEPHPGGRVRGAGGTAGRFLTDAIAHLGNPFA